MKMIIDWDTVIAMSEEIDSGNSLGTKKKMIDLDDLYSIGEKIIEYCGPREYKYFQYEEGRDLSWKFD